jgi:hypothetical protein
MYTWHHALRPLFELLVNMVKAIGTLFHQLCYDAVSRALFPKLLQATSMAVSLCNTYKELGDVVTVQCVDLLLSQHRIIYRRKQACPKGIHRANAPHLRQQTMRGRVLPEHERSAARRSRSNPSDCDFSLRAGNSFRVLLACALAQQEESAGDCCYDRSRNADS